MLNPRKQERFDNLKVGGRVMTPEGVGQVVTFDDRPPMRGAVVKYPDGKIRGRYFAHDIIVLGVKMSSRLENAMQTLEENINRLDDEFILNVATDHDITHPELVREWRKRNDERNL